MRPGLTAIVTYRPDGSQPKHLSELAHVSPPVYSFTTPGGCQDLTATVYRMPSWRTDALSPGRIVKAFRGGMLAWSGILDEPVPTAAGWTLSAHGTGVLGQDYRAVWTGTWGTSTPDQVISNAISAGLPWINPGIGSPAGMWMGQQTDSASQSVTDLLTLICNKGGLTWEVTTASYGNVLSVFPLPSAPNRLLVATGPVPRSVAAGATMIRIRYQNAGDSGKKPATYALTSVTDADRETEQGHTEDYMDLSSAGVQTSGQAQAVGSQVLKRFTRAAFTEQFPAVYGHLLNTGGVPVDPGCFYADGIGAMVCRLLLADLGYAGDIARGPVQFLVGEYEWNDATCVATITPFESLRHNWSSLLSVAAQTAPVHRHRATHKHKKGR
jgi:hypothetical protein